MLGRYLETLTWAQAEKAIAQMSAVVLPIGSRSLQHGLHLPLNQDSLVAEYLAMRVAEQCRVLVLPTLQYGCSPGLNEYPGSISIRGSVFRDTVVDIFQGMAEHGAAAFYALSTGSCSVEPLRQSQAFLRGESLRMDYTDARGAFAPVRRLVETQPDGSHADEIATSIMLYIAPEVVQMDRAQRDINPNPGTGNLTRNPAGQDGVYSPTGSYGDPTLATLEKGEVLVEGMVASLVEHIQRFILEPQHVVALTMPTGEVAISAE